MNAATRRSPDLQIPSTNTYLPAGKQGPRLRLRSPHVGGAAG